MRHNGARTQRVISEPEMSPETTIVELDLEPEEWAQLMRIAEARSVSLEELVAVVVKRYLANSLPPPSMSHPSRKNLSSSPRIIIFLNYKPITIN